MKYDGRVGAGRDGSRGPPSNVTTMGVKGTRQAAASVDEQPLPGTARGLVEIGNETETRRLAGYLLRVGPPGKMGYKTAT